jgi:FlaA1/EpsC-like NDP-sugar epimerase
MSLLSIREQLAGSTILVTGGLGGVGSTCLEQLLRQTEVRESSSGQG